MRKLLTRKNIETALKVAVLVLSVAMDLITNIQRKMGYAPAT